MPNQYFQFKQFTIQQGNCAMKVTTDGCLFGAIVSSFCTPAGHHTKVLDIGTGTGLLALMYAQQNDAVLIDTIEIDEKAALQCAENFAASPWGNRLHAECTSLQNYTPQNLYNLIITNPPFYEKQLTSGNSRKDLAHHSTALSLQELLVAAKRLLTTDGTLAILLPFYRETEALQLAISYGLSPSHAINIKQTPNHNFFRSILILRQDHAEFIRQELKIKDENMYSNSFIQLLTPYYLNL